MIQKPHPETKRRNRRYSTDSPEVQTHSGKIAEGRGKGEKFTEPALYLSTQTTVPILTQIMAGISLALITVALSVQKSVEIWGGIDTSNVALTLFGISAVLFWLATEACINSQGWDYFALSQERRDYKDLSTDKSYIDDCGNESEHWHTLAVRLYRFGGGFVVCGVLVLIWPTSFVTTLLVLALYVAVLGVFMLHKRKRMDRLLKQ
jgi:hypothetical protein